MRTTVKNAKRRSVCCLLSSLAPAACVKECVCTEDHSEADVHQVAAQRPLYPPHALRLRLGERALHQI